MDFEIPVLGGGAKRPFIAGKATRPAGTRGHHVRRVVAHWSRVLHTYLSMASFSILFFFAATAWFVP